jgi:dihydrofolate reductase
MGHALVMGRRTWQSLPQALPGRQNIIVTHQRAFDAPGALVVHTLHDALKAVSQPAPAFCIGGAVLFREALPLASVAYVTEIDAEFDGDATFPRLDGRIWQERERESRPFDATLGFAYAFVKYERAG